jgi:hypothetical protein
MDARNKGFGWWNKRRLEIVKDFDPEICRRAPKMTVFREGFAGPA